MTGDRARGAWLQRALQARPGQAGSELAEGGALSLGESREDGGPRCVQGPGQPSWAGWGRQVTYT